VGAFVTMQLLHFSLATKQPSMTAATLAGAIEAQRDEGKLELAPLVDIVARASRTQFTALVGNVFLVIPFSVAIGVFFEAWSGHHVLDDTQADTLIAQHHPLGKSTLFSAAMTGVWLWAASLIAGAAENYFVLRELPGAIASNRRLRRLFGAQRTTRFARFLTHEAGALGGNLGFGFLLGFMPLFFILLGLPLDGGHVTFISSQLAYAAVEQGPMVLSRSDFLLALLSVPLVGLTNFAVSFAFAIVVALRARGLGVRGQLRLARAVGKRFLRNPREFFLAPRESQPTPVPQTVTTP
jgi:site-specific recombinase